MRFTGLGDGRQPPVLLILSIWFTIRAWRSPETRRFLMARLQRSRHRGSALAPLALLFVLAGCARSGEETALPSPGASPAPAAAETAEADGLLAGTAWRLVEFQSMDDATGAVRPEASQRFTMRLDPDGSVSMELDCNRATGTWSAEPSEDGQSGRFEFGPLAMTRALCPPPNLDERIGRDAEYVRGYLLREGRLYLSLMADAGVYAWEPLSETDDEVSGIPFETDPDPRLETAIREVSPDYTQETVEIGGSQARYLYARFDLNGDGNQETFAYLLGSIFCGTGGCNLMLFVEGEGGYTLINNFPISRLPVLVSDQETEGWKDLIRRESGGGAPPSLVRHSFDGQKYVEQERLPVDLAPAGTEVMFGDFIFEDGLPLPPND